MSIKEYFYDSILTNDLTLDINEAARRLNIEKYLTNGIIEECDNALREAIDCKYCGVKVEVKCSEDAVVLGFINVESKDLARTLNSSHEAYVMAVTLGNGVDRLLNKLSVTSVVNHFITDALASAYAETAANYVEEKIKGDNICTRRFSPGYGDLPLSIQDKVLDLINASRLLNININKSLLMTPTKSITAIMGIKE